MQHAPSADTTLRSGNYVAGRGILGHKTTGFRSRLFAIVATVAALIAIVAPTSATTTTTLNPIGGGYSSTTEREFVQLAVDHASGSAVRILVIPSAYAHTSLGYAQAHVDELQGFCTELTNAGCSTVLVPLWKRSDAEDPANVAMISNPVPDGIFILGGDQDAAMQILADTPAEAAMATAFDDGAIVSGTSAGDAVESYSMLADYANGGNPGNALQQDKVSVWWGDGNEPRRGLSFGSQSTILDQHFFQRGRFTRLLNVTAQSVDRYGGEGKLGVGVDYETSVQLTNDNLLSNVVGNTSVAIIDFSHASHDWVDPNNTLSARNVLTQIVPPGNYSYDVANRQVMSGGNPVPAATPTTLPSLTTTSNAPLWLGGDVLSGGSVLSDFVNQAQSSSSHTIVVVAAGYFSSGDASSAGNAYAQALKKLGWSRSGDTVQVVNFEAHTEWSRVMPSLVDGAAGVIFVGGDQSQMARPLADATFKALVAEALSNSSVVLTDRAMTPVMGDYYVTNADPTDKNVQSAGIDDFHTGVDQFAEGLHYVNATLEPRFMTDQRWGRLYSLARHDQGDIAYGIDEQTAIELSSASATVAGNYSVVALDGRTASFADASNGAYAALNVYLNLFAPGETLP